MLWAPGSFSEGLGNWQGPRRAWPSIAYRTQMLRAVDAMEE